MNLREFIKATTPESDTRFLMRPLMFCKDGFIMSVQGSYAHYCSPRETQDWYNSMEIGFPSAKEELLMYWAESPEKPVDTVYGYVPCNVIEEVIEKHGGIDVTKTFENKEAL